MKKTTIAPSLCAAALLFLASGCSGGQNTVGKGFTTPPPNGHSASSVKSANDRALEERLRNDGRMTPEFFKSRLKPGMTQEEAQAAFGHQYVVITRDQVGISMWRFDYGDAGYQFQQTQPDHPDVDGLRKGMLATQLFITWDPGTGKATKEELYYKVSDSHANHDVNKYTVYDNGQTNEGRVD